MVMASCSVATGGGGSGVLQLNQQYTYAKHLPCQSCVSLKSKFVGTVDKRLGWLRLSKIGGLLLSTAATSSGATCWFKFGKNGVDAEQAGIYGSQSRNDFDRDDVEQILLDVVSVFNAVSSLSRKEQSVKLTQDGLEVYRDLYPAREQAVYLDCVWQTDKFVLLGNISERVGTNQDAILRDVYPGGGSTVQYQCIETLLGDTDEPVTVDQSFTCEQGSSDIKGNNPCFLEGSTDRTNDGKLVRDGRERQCVAGAAAICSEKRLSEGAFLKDKSESRNKVAFVSVKMPITSAQDAVIPVKDIESCSANTEDPAFRLIADGNLKESLL